MGKVLIFGDSVGWGAFDFDKGGWVERLKMQYFKTFKLKGISVYNLGISGNDTNGILFQLENDVKKFRLIEPEKLTLIFSIGSNDSRYIGTKENIVVSIKKFRENLYKIIEVSKRYSKRIIFTGLTKINENKVNPWGDNEYYEIDRLKKYDKIIETICEEKGLEFIPLLDLLSDEDLEDGLHLNSIGHEKIFHYMEEYFLSNKLR